ncbi:MAG: hypothetical protein ACLP5H_27555 [Desulfomonilaceae bacterium]
MSFTIFYAWQSDTENAVNRSCIEKAADMALKEIALDLELVECPRMDQATQDVAGMCDIASSIMEKIKTADVFLADMTLVGTIEKSGRKTPNPNVLFELGYAVRHLDWESIVPVMNLAYGRPEEQIFDLRGRRFLTYELARGDTQEGRKRVKVQLAGAIRNALRTIFAQRGLTGSASTLTDDEAVRKTKQLIKADDFMGLDEFVTGEARKLASELAPDHFADLQPHIRAEDVETRLEAYATVTNRLALVLATGCRWGNENHSRIWKESIEIISHLPQRLNGQSHEYEICRCLRLYPVLMSFYAAGIGAMIGDHADTLRFLFYEPKVPFRDLLQQPAVALTTWEVEARRNKQYIGGSGSYITLKAALSRQLHDTLAPMIKPMLAREEDYPYFFGAFEYLLGLCCLQQIQKGVEGRDRSDAPVVMFATRDDGMQVLDRMEAELEKEKDNWPLLKAHVLQGPYSQCKAAMAVYRKEVELYRFNQRYGRRSSKYPV